MTGPRGGSALSVTADFSALTGPVEINQCCLLIDDAEIGCLGLEFVGSDVTVVRPGDPVPLGVPIVMATTRVGDLDGEARAWGLAERIDTVVTERDGHLARRLLSDDDHPFGTLDSVTVGEHLIAFDFRSTQASDVPGAEFWNSSNA